MKIYDITRELLSAPVYPGDPAPKKEMLASMEQGDLYNLTALSLCAHNGTHLDAPRHFLKDGASIEEIALEKTVGRVFVAECCGVLLEEDAKALLLRAQKALGEPPRRLLIKGKAEVSLEAAEVFVKARLDLVGNESQTVGPQDAPMAVHLALLGAGTVLLEGVDLEKVPEGVYLLSAAPLLIKGADGAPVRAYLIEGFEKD